jgi:hypothetical protein
MGGQISFGRRIKEKEKMDEGKETKKVRENENENEETKKPKTRSELTSQRKPSLKTKKPTFRTHPLTTTPLTTSSASLHNPSES